MPRKSNKTEHVLKLITKNQEAEEEKKSRKRKAAVEEVTSSVPEEPIEPEVEFEERPNAHIEDVGFSLEQLEASFAGSPQPAAEQSVQEQQVQAQGTIEEIQGTEEAETQNRPYSGVVYEPEKRETIKSPPMLARDICKLEHKIAPPIKRNSADISVVNLSEILVAELMDEVMKKLSVCNCSTCRADVLALALNHIKQKYITTDPGRQHIQLDVYRKQYEAEILSALTRACVMVKGSPRHN